MDNTLLDTLKWCAENEITFKITLSDGLLVVEGGNRNISTLYAIQGSDSTALGNAIYSAVYALEAGTNFHATHGFMPSQRACNPNPSSKGDRVRDDNGSGVQPPPPGLWAEPKT